MSITQGLKRAMQIGGRGTATIFGTRRRTWQEFGQRVTRLAGALRGMGLASGGRVAILALNSDRYLECYYAVPWAGGIVVPINVRLAPPEIIYALNDSGAEVLVVDAVFKAMLPAFSGKLDTVRRIIFAADAPTPEGAQNYEQLLAAAEPIPDAMRGGDDVAGIFYTGGTTGQAKGVMLTHNNLISNAMNVIAALHYNQETVYLHAAPMFHLADGSSTFGVTMCAVVGIPSEEWGEAVHAIVVPKEGQEVAEEAIIARCKELIAGYKCPRSVEIRQEALPISGAGKILKSELRRPFWEGHERQVN